MHIPGASDDDTLCLIYPEDARAPVLGSVLEGPPEDILPLVRVIGRGMTGVSVGQYVVACRLVFYEGLIQSFQTSVPVIRPLVPSFVGVRFHPGGG